MKSPPRIPTRQDKVLITGTASLIRHHLPNCLVDMGYRVCGMDIEHGTFYQIGPGELRFLDLPRSVALHQFTLFRTQPSVVRGTRVV